MQWLLQLLGNQLNQMKREEVEQELIQPVVLDRFKREQMFKVCNSFDIKAVTDFCVRHNAYNELHAFVDFKMENKFA